MHAHEHKDEADDVGVRRWTKSGTKRYGLGQSVLASSMMGVED
jgi:hypothetical protein